MSITAGRLYRYLLFSLLGLLALLAAYRLGHSPQPPARPGTVFYNFENDSQLDHINWQCGTTFRRVQKHAADGRWSLAVTMYPKPNPWPGFGTGFTRGIAPGGSLELAIFNPASRPLKLSYRIDDRPNPPYSDRLNGHVILQPGANSVCFDFSRLKTPGTRRWIKPESIYRFFLFLHHPENTTTIYIDHLGVVRCPSAGRPEGARKQPPAENPNPTATGENRGHETFSDHLRYGLSG